MPAAAQATSAIGDYGRDLRPAKWGSGATAKQQSGARECPLWVCERGGVTGDALDFALETTRSKKSDVRDQLMSLFVTLDPFPEVPNVLRKLKTAGMRTAILSNGSPAMLDAAVKAARLEPLLDAVLSVEEVGVYKPHPKVYQLAVDRLAIPASAICYQSSNAWDAYAASAFGMQVVWCNRYGQRRERLPGSPDREIGSLTQLPALVGAT